MMKRAFSLSILTVLLSILLFETGVSPMSDATLSALIEKLRPLYKPLGAPEPGEWLTAHREAGQTFNEYTLCHPVVPDKTRKIIYIQPLGDFSRTQRSIIDKTSLFMGAYFSLPVKVLPPLPLSMIPDRARRTHPSWGDRQILSGYVLYQILLPHLPIDAFASIAFTTSDLWPGEGWNFVFGQASLRDRVGVWSIYRNGNPDESENACRLCLKRTLKTATHEMGHMFSMQHCILYQCNMCGSNSRHESDKRPLELCPECMAKVCWATGVKPEKRCGELLKLCREFGLTAEAEFYQKLASVLKTKH